MTVRRNGVPAASWGLTAWRSESTLGETDRLIPAGERALLWIAEYLVEVRPQLDAAPDAEHLFLGGWGEPLSVSWLTGRVRDYVTRANVGKNGLCRLLRHTVPTLMLGRKGAADEPDAVESSWSG